LNSTRFFLFFFCVFSALYTQETDMSSDLAIEEGFYLDFPLQVKALQTFETHMEIESLSSQLPFKEEIKQKLTGRLELHSKEGSSRPSELEFVLEQVSLDLKQGEKSFSFNSQEMEESVESLPIRQVLNKPFRFAFDQNFRFESKGQESFLLHQDLGRQNFSELFSYFFILAGQDLKSGKRLEINKHLHIDINRADQEQIQASFGGSLAKENLSNGSLEGIVSGTGSWKKNNALFHKIKVHKTLSGTLSVKGQSLPVKVKMVQWIQSHPILF